MIDNVKRLCYLRINSNMKGHTMIGAALIVELIQAGLIVGVVLFTKHFLA